jgi:undecaprenyl diphosphate synthase
LAINYGSRGEIVDAVKKIVEEKIPSGQIDEQCIADHLYTAGMSDPDLLIRTAGEWRLSNYLLWQLSYAEIWVTEKCWPDFDAALFDQALTDFAQRERKFGGLQGPE